MRMRTMLLLPLLLIPVLLTSASLLVLRRQMQRQMHEVLDSDLQRSAATYRNLEQQRRITLVRETILLSYQPSLKALMTTQDPRTIQEAGAEYATLSDTDLLALLSPSGDVVALYDESSATLKSGSRKPIAGLLPRQLKSPYLFDGERLFEIASQPIYFGPAENNSLLGYVVIGSVIDDAVALQVSQAADSEIAFSVGSKIISGTLATPARLALAGVLDNSKTARQRSIAFQPGAGAGVQSYLIDHVNLAQDNVGPIALIVLRSTEDLRRTQTQINHVVLAIGFAALFAGGVLAFAFAKSLTSPLESLAAAVAAVGAGDYLAQLPRTGAVEIRALSASVESMRREIRKTQSQLLEAERLATIGQMASSISHDLRHYLASVYANAEFLAATKLSEAERADLLAEIHLSVQGTTDLIDSLLLFTRTGRALHVTYESVTYLAERAILMVSKHPEALNIPISLSSEGAVEAWVDGRKIERAIYNLLLNGCQAARRGATRPRVTIEISEKQGLVQLRVGDSGPGISVSIRDSLFEPFVSADKATGVGIGLTLASKIAQEHGGSVSVEATENGATVFLFTLDREAAHRAPHPAVREGETQERNSVRDYSL